MHRQSHKMSLGGRDSMQGSSVKKARTSSATPLMRSVKRQPVSMSGNQRQSYVAQEHQLITDDRPIKNKAYMKRCVMDLIHLLTDLGYPNTVYPKMMNPPTNREYQRILQFLVTTICNHHMDKPDEDMLHLVKALGYPYMISKSTLNNVGPMSAWPHALGVLTWLAGIVKVKQDNNDVDLPNNNMLKVELVQAEYQEFMSGNDGPFNEIENEIERKLAEIHKDVPKEKEKQRTKAESLFAICKQHEAEKESNKLLVEQISIKNENMRKMEKYLSDIDLYIEDKKTKTKDIDQATTAIESESDVMVSETRNIENAVAAQEMNLTDLKKLSMAKKQLADTLLSESEAAENNKKLEWDLEIETTKVLVTMDEKVKMQNSAMRKLLSTLPSELAPSESEIPPTLNTGNVGFEGNCTKQQSIISPYLLEQSKRALSHVKKLESSNYAAKTLAQEHDMIMDLKKNKEELQSAHKELLQKTQNQTKEYTKQMESKKLELESEKLKCGQLMAQSSEPVAAEQQRLIDNQNELKEKREVLAKICEDGEIEFGLKLEEHTAFKLECRKMVDDFYHHVQQQNEEYVAQVQADAKEIQELHDSRFRPIKDNR